jgi:hypothetical protein
MPWRGWWRSTNADIAGLKRQWWQREAKEVITEIRSVKDQLASTLVTLQEFELRLSDVADRQAVLNEARDRGGTTTDA